MKMRLVAWMALFGMPGLAAAAESGDYLADVKPLLAKRCVACHGALKQKAGLRLDTAARILQGGESGPAVVAGQSSESLLLEAVVGDDGWRMPPEGEPLSAPEVARIRAWIDQGAPVPAGEPEPADPRRHWAFVPPVRPPIPHVADAAGLKNPIDAFLAAEHQARGIQPLPAADKEVLLRRVALDLTGLAPTPEELRAFLHDPSEDAYERAVDRFLASPRYGERWGRHWMDVWRYSDWDGYGKEVRESQPHVWRWRDWIVESLNRDRGYDRMILEMIAADELAPDDPKAVRATGYLVRNWYKFNRNVWLDNIVEHTAKAFLGVTLNCARCHDHKYDPIAQADYYRFRAFFEPHGIRTDRVPGQLDPQKDGLVRVYDADATTPTFLFERGDEKRPVKEKPLSPGVPAVLAREGLAIEAVALPATSSYPGLREFARRETLAQAEADLAAKRTAFDRANRALIVARQTTDALTLPGQGPDVPASLAAARQAEQKAEAAAALAEKALVAAEAAEAAARARLAADAAKYATPPSPEFPRLALEAGRAERWLAVATADRDRLQTEQAAAEAASPSARPGAKPARKASADPQKAVKEARTRLETALKALAKDGPDYTPLGPVYPATSTGRRLALARWMVSRQNPLTARVAVNHVWMRHFGAPLVETVFDFGLNGKGPSHPALLDWLATEFMDCGWSMKRLHRLIVTSQAYRRRSSTEGSSESNRALDPANRWLWRMNAHRMEAEVVRDNLLYAAGTLEEALGGPDLAPEAGQTSRRRSLYFRHAKEKRVLFLKLFDSANATSCYRRSESVVPQQALALANSPVAFEQARILAGAISRAVGLEPTPEAGAAFVGTAFERVLGREPTAEERSACEAYLVEQASRLADRASLHAFPTGPAGTVKPAGSPTQRARESLVHVLFNHSDFVTIR